MKYSTLFITLVANLFFTLNAFADDERCLKIFQTGTPEVTTYSDLTNAYYRARQGLGVKCSCRISFKLQPNEQYIGTVFNGKILPVVILGSEDAIIANDDKYWDRKLLNYYKYWSSTLNYLASFVEKNKRCPNEDEYQELKSFYLEDKNIYKKTVDSNREEENNRSALHEKENFTRLSLVKKFCSGVPKINLVVIENISFVVKVDPQLIRLNRVNIADDGHCFATFHTPKGVVIAWVDFNQNGIITKNGRIFFNR